MNNAWTSRLSTAVCDIASSIQDTVRTDRMAPSKDLRKLHACQLEDRILYSASPLSLVGADSSVETEAEVELLAGEELSPWFDADPHQTTDEAESPLLDSSNHGSASLELASPVDSLLLGPVDSPRREVVFVDAGADRFQDLVEDLRLQIDASRVLEVVVLNSSDNGIQQISDTLRTYNHLDAVHIVSHGNDGRIKLGDAWLDSDSLEAFSAQIERWGAAMTADGDLLFYGCELASNAEGQLLVESLSELTGADVAASVDDTGAEELGGDWDLEVATGEITTTVAFSQSIQEQWHGLLDAGALEPNSPDVPITASQLTIEEGGTVIITTTNLGGPQPTTPDPLTEYTVSNITGGQFELTSNPSAAVTAFTQSQVDDGEVVFVDDGDEEAPRFNVQASDPNHFTVAASRESHVAELPIGWRYNGRYRPYIHNDSTRHHLIHGYEYDFQFGLDLDDNANVWLPLLHPNNSGERYPGWLTFFQLHPMVDDGDEFTSPSVSLSIRSEGPDETPFFRLSVAGDHDLNSTDDSLQRTLIEFGLPQANHHYDFQIGFQLSEIGQDNGYIKLLLDGETIYEDREAVNWLYTEQTDPGDGTLRPLKGPEISAYRSSRLMPDVPITLSFTDVAFSHRLNPREDRLVYTSTPASVSLLPKNDASVANQDHFQVSEDGDFQTDGLWWFDSWQDRQKVTFDNSAPQAEVLRNYPVLVTLDANDVNYDLIKPNGVDLRFVDADGLNVLEHEIETWNPNGQSRVWVQVPKVDQGSSVDHVWLYYNNPDAAAVAGGSHDWVPDNATHDASFVQFGVEGLLSNDLDVDGDVLRVTAVNGNSANVGDQITLASGALLTVRSDGSFAYHTNGRFDHLNEYEVVSEQFSYTTSDGLTTDSTTVTLDVRGEDDATLLETNELTVADGGNVRLTTDNVFDVILTSANGELFFTVHNVIGGQFEFSTVPGISVGGFSKTQINTGEVIFVVHTDAIAASYQVGVSDSNLSSHPAPASNGKDISTLPTERDTPAPSTLLTATLVLDPGAPYILRSVSRSLHDTLSMGESWDSSLSPFDEIRERSHSTATAADTDPTRANLTSFDPLRAHTSNAPTTLVHEPTIDATNVSQAPLTNQSAHNESESPQLSAAESTFNELAIEEEAEDSSLTEIILDDSNLQTQRVDAKVLYEHPLSTSDTPTRFEETNRQPQSQLEQGSHHDQSSHELSDGLEDVNQTSHDVWPASEGPTLQPAQPEESGLSHLVSNVITTLKMVLSRFWNALG